MTTIQKRSKKGVHFSLALTIGLIISCLLVALGIAITLYTYENEKKTALATTEKIFAFSSLHTEEKLVALIHPVESFVTVSSALQGIDIGGVENLSLLLPYFHQSFVSLPWMDSFYVGYNNGAFYMVQAIRGNELVRKAFSAPDQAAYAVKILTPDTTGTIGMELRFYDVDLVLLETRTGVHDGYDPRQRDWYSEAISTKKTVITKPYIFHTSRQIGITVAHSLDRGEGVVGADSVLATLSQLLQKQKLTPSTQIVIMEENGRVIFSTGEGDLAQLQEIRETDETAELYVAELTNQAANILYKDFVAKGVQGTKIIEVNGEKWFGHARQLAAGKRSGIYIAIVSPFEELMVNARTVRERNLLIMLSVLIVAVGLGLYLSRRIAQSLHDLSVQAENIRDFQLTTSFTVQSKISEVGDLAETMTVMQSAINRFVEIARALSAEKQMERVLEMIVTEAQSITGADGGAIGLVSDDGKSFSYVQVRNTVTGVHLGGTSGQEINLAPLSLADKAEQQEVLEVSVVRDAETKAFADITLLGKETCSSIRQLHEKEGYECHSLLVIPLLNRQDEVIGLLHLVNARAADSAEIVAFAEHKITYVRALSSNAALALDNNRLIRAQKELFDSFVRLIAGAIDTKSPYTGGHCQRVPLLAGMLADAASSATTPGLKNFHLSEDERYELFVASWLHDCGKVTTPEYVVDKATKLETIYNRIHEIRTRFEVLWRDADIDYYKGIIEAPESREQLQEEREKQRQQLRDDFSFIAECNEGSEFMAPGRVKRLQEIGSRIWERNFDHRQGLSGDERARQDMDSEISLPVSETLLADKDEHILPRLDGGKPYGENPWKFTMPVPEHRYNLGELYNLSIAKGTLTTEERYKINDHIVQTIIMLNSLPFPKEIRRVPDWAGNHHEKLDGSGYPRCLTADQLSIPERIMAVADIFEALTAADRPYKTPKTLSACIDIMSFMRNDGHICPDLFELLLKSGIYREYAEKHMQPEQIDEVDVAAYFK
ncbi:MAG: GAF domain-containing protein [Proteobacteria bacterium]|nr:GAF domain-containing protein [Pseudomonadota bacterium]